MTDQSLILLNIENIDEDNEFDLNKNDREIFFKDIGVRDRDIESFISIDEYVDYIKLNFVKNGESRDLLKLCAEYMAIEISIENMHTISFKKGKELYKENMRKLRVDNVKYIISVEDRKKGKKINSTITVPFTTKIFVKYLNKFFLHPFDKPIKEGKPKLIPVYNVNTTNLNIKSDINKSFKLKENRFLIPKDINQLKYIILRNLDNVQKSEKDYHFINEISDVFSNTNVKDYKINDQLNFLKAKPSKDGKNIQNLYYSFDINNNINLLEKIINLGLENEYISLILNKLNDETKQYSIYEENINLLIKQNAKLSRLEQLCKIKYPNFFNPSRKEFTFGKGTKFSIDLLPVDYKKSLLLEFNIKESLENKMISNKCEHKSKLDYLRKNIVDYRTWNDFKSKFLKKEEKSPIIPCNLCEMPTLCIHEVEFNDMFYKNYNSNNNSQKDNIINQTERINQIITTKYASKSTSSTSSSSYSSFCKHCGMKILNMVNTDGVSYDESQNMYSDSSISNVNGVNSEVNEDKKTILYAINRNISFTKPVGKTTVNSIISGIYDNLQPILRILNKKKSIKLQTSLSKEMNIVILTIVSIMILSMKYDFIEIKNTGKLKKSIIISSKDRNVKGVGLKFKEAWEAFNNNYETMIKQSPFSNKTESLKQLFVKSYDLLKENLQENILLSESNNITNTSVYQEYLDIYTKIKLKAGINEEYKEKSYNLFSSFINNNLGEIYLSDRKENQLWNKWMEESKYISNMEKKIVQLSIKKILYPYSRIKYSYNRYYKTINGSNNSDLSLYACSVSGKQHVWDKYIFKSKDNKEVSFNIKTISSNDKDLNIIKNSKIHALSCKTCKKNTIDLKESNENYPNIITNRINDLTEIDSFYSTYRYRCLNSPFHTFKYKDGIYICTSCQMNFDFIVNKDESFYYKNKKIFENFKNQKSIQKNQELFNHTNQNVFIKQMDLTKNINIEANKNKEIMKDKLSDKIQELNNLNISFKKKCLENLGESENILESEYYDSNISSVKYNDVFSKNLDKVRQIIIYLGIIINTPYKHKYIKDEDFLNVVDYANSSNVRNELTILYKYLTNLKIIDSFHAYRSINPDSTNGAINYIKSFILHLIKQIQNISKEISQFILDKIIDSDIIYTSYNYAELKKTYNMNKIIEDQFNAVSVDDELESPEDDYDLFDSSDLSMNNFADDDLE